MVMMSPVNKRNITCSVCRNISVKLIVFTFIGLIVFVGFNMTLSFARMSVIVDMSIKMRSNVIGVLNNIVDLSSADSLNGTFTMKSIAERERNENRQSVHFQFTEEHFNSFQKNLTVHGKENNVVLEQNKTDNDSVRINHVIDKYQSYQSENFNKRSGNKTSNKTDGSKNLYQIISSKQGHHHIGKTDIVNKYGNTVNTKTNVRQQNCSSCFQHNFKYIIQNERICKLYSSNQTIHLLVLIMTTHKNYRARAALRSTWLSYTQHNAGNVRYVFLLGEVSDNRQREAITDENRVHHDIIKEDFTDTYMNLTYKTIMGFKWASSVCQHALYVLKTDDDMYVNIPNLLKMLTGPNKDKLHTSVMGTCTSKARPIRSKSSKWFASVSSYPDKFYPGFCSGTGYVTSMNVVKQVYIISPSIPFFHLEDVYVSLCIKKLGFKLQSMSGFNAGRPKFDPCVYKGGKLITAHQLTPIMLQMIWGRQCIRKTKK